MPPEAVCQSFSHKPRPVCLIDGIGQRKPQQHDELRFAAFQLLLRGFALLAVSQTGLYAGTWFSAMRHCRLDQFLALALAIWPQHSRIVSPLYFPWDVSFLTYLSSWQEHNGYVYETAPG